MATFSFLHAADIHLDSPLRGLSRYDGVPLDEVRMATRVAFTRLIDEAIAREVAFLVIAGDLFDGEPKDIGGRHAVAAGFGRLGRAGIDVYALRGNHDAESQLMGTLPQMAHVHWFDHRRPQTLVHQATGAVLHGQGFPRREVLENLVAHYPDPRDGFNIGVLHTALDGAAGHDPYAPCLVDELLAKHYQYWALGHVHAHAVRHQDPPVVFPGCLQGRSIRETGPKGAILVEVDDGRVQPPLHIALDVVRWAAVEVDAAGAARPDEVIDRLRTKLEGAHAAADGRPLLVRVAITGATPAHGALLDAAAGRDAVRLLAAGVSRDIWVEKVVLGTVRPPGPRLTEAAGALDLATLLDPTDPAVVDRLQTELGPLLARFPTPEPGSLLAAARAGAWSDLTGPAAGRLIARLDEAG